MTGPWELQEKVFSAIKEKYRYGMTELDIAKIIDEICDVWQGDIISGPRTADIEGGPTDRVLEKGDALMLDLQILVDGVWSDITRMFFVDYVSEEKKNAFSKVLTALRKGEEYLKEGTVVEDLYSVMRDAINDDAAFSHHAGHLVSDAPLVQPQFLPGRKETLEQGMIVTLEPGIYFEKNFGIRLENNYRITKDGYVPLYEEEININDFILKGGNL